MRITKVELENIKSYKSASIPFFAGTVAIRGHNGAGKSTLVEAIGFALFDTLNYDQSQFVREGEKAGTVTVSFISALDDREYQAVRRCGSNPAWYIFDPELEARPAEQKVDVTDFLRKHLCIETEIKLSDLFNDALGVPQGAFTADFLLTPANRKKKFDTLLQVEDYRKAAENLNNTRNYLLDEQRAVEKRMDDLTRETSQLDAWRTELQESRRRERALTQQLAALQREAAKAESRRDALRRREAEVTRLAGAAQVAQAERDAKQAVLQDAEARLAEAREAVEVRTATSADHSAHVAAQRSLSEVRERMHARDELVSRQAQVSREREGAAADLRHSRERLAAATAAERRLAELFPAITQQHDWEEARDAAQRDCQRLEELQRTLTRTGREYEQLLRDIADTERRITELDALRPEAALLEERREHVAMLQDQRARGTEREDRLRSLAAERAKAEKQRTRAVQQEAKEHANVQKLLESRAVAEAAPALEQRHAALQSQAQKLEARLEHNRLSRQQSGAGNCPFLREPCLNIQRRGENSLASYFDHLIEEDERALAPLRTQLEQVAADLAHAKTVVAYVARLDEYRERHAAARDALAELDDTLRALAQQQAELEEWLRALPGEKEMREAQTLFKRSDDADKKLREIAPRQAELKRLRDRLDATEQERASLRQQADALAGAVGALREAEAALTRLGNPRREADALEGAARERPELEAQVARREQILADLDARLAEVAQALRPFAGLDDEMRTLDDELKRTQEGHSRYLRYERLAARLPECEAAAAQATADAQRAAKAHERAEAAHRAALADFDPDELQRVTSQADTLSTERGRTTEALSQTQHDAERLTAEIARVEALLADLEAAGQERETIDDLLRMLQQFRETIREAGPSIMKALLRQISVEANRIFGEIMGDRSAQLSWESDYEVVLRRDGRERSFAQLSGGEQMSAALAVRLALLRIFTRLNIAFFDEPTQNMDGERRGNLAEQIRRVRGFDQLIVISHDDTFEQGLDSVIFLEKRSGETKRVEEDALVLA